MHVPYKLPLQGFTTPASCTTIRVHMEVADMTVDKSSTISEGRFSSEGFRIQLTDPILYDRLHTLSAEYSLSVEMLVNVAVKRLVEDVDFVRSLRTGKVEGA